MTTFEHILRCKPFSIFDWVPPEVFIERTEKGHEYISGGHCYEWKYAVAKYLQPRSICEIGVRYGYSLCCFAVASPMVNDIVGIDSEIYKPGSNAMAMRNLETVTNVKPTLIKRSSIEIQGIGHYDLVHIDGSHNYENCLHDLNLARHSGAILVDDVDKCDDDRRACVKWIEEQGPRVLEVVHLPSLHGDLLILLQSGATDGERSIPHQVQAVQPAKLAR